MGIRQVTGADIDQNGHMNNGRYLAWITQLLPPNARLQDVKLCYLSEALEGETLTMCWVNDSENQLSVDICRNSPTGENQRIFSARLVFETSVL
jgi:acyl-ACP thioesterase